MMHLGVEGTVTIGFVVDATGAVRDPQVVRSNNPWFERPAIDAILKWKFQPGVKGGKPVNSRVMQPVDFSLNDAQGRAAWVIKKAKNHDQLPEPFRWDKAPRPVNTSFPVYPFEALRAKQQAKFVILLLVDPTGSVIEARIKDEVSAAFAGAARAMAAMWEFEPARKADGAACHAMIGIELDFKPDGRGSAPVPDTAMQILRELARSEPRIVEAGDLDAIPKEVTNRRIPFPLGLRAQKVEGEAVVEFYIDREGDAQLPRVISATNDEFAHSAALAAACWRFEPPKKEGKSVVARVRRPVRFTLKDEP